MATPERPTRLKIPSPQGRAARSLFDKVLVFADGADIKVVWVPVIQWANIKLRVRISGTTGTITAEFGRPARQTAVLGQQNSANLPAFVYANDQPAAGAVALADGIENELDVTAAEHAGENWLRVTIDPVAAGTIDFCDISGVLLGLGG